MSKNALYVLDTEPLIIHGITWRHVLNPVWTYGPLLKGRQAYFLLSLSWSLLDTERLKHMVLHYHIYKENFPEHTIIILCNEKEEVTLLRRFHIPAIFANHNALLDYSIYKPAPECEKLYDGILNSRLDRWKRHILARTLTRPALITYGFLNTPAEHTYLAWLRRAFPHGCFLNYAENGEYNWLAADELGRAYSQSYTGLILSAVEGACFTSCEYLLAGLPVASTKNLGGRDVFFSPEFTRTVEASQDAVRDAVEDLKSRALRPEDIRAATITRIDELRTGFIEAWQTAYDREGVCKDARVEWTNKYRNKMVVTLSDAEVPAYLSSSGALGPCTAEMPAPWDNNEVLHHHSHL